MEKNYIEIKPSPYVIRWPIMNVEGDIVRWISVSRPTGFPLKRGSNDVAWIGYDESRLLLGVVMEEDESVIHWYHDVNSTIAESVMNSGYVSVLNGYADLIESIELYLG